MADKKKEIYGGAYDQQINDLYNQYTNRPEFTYNVNDDALYQQYKDRYVENARRAMKDTMGQAASLTGGYGSSYSQGVGQQAYGETIRGLTDMIPALSDRAYQRYKDQGDQILTQFNLANQLGATAYNRGRDELADEWKNKEWDFTQQQYADQRGDVAWNRDFQERQYADQRGDVAWNRDFQERQSADQRGDVAWNRDFQERQYGDTRSDAQREWDFRQQQYADALQQYADQRAFQERQYADTRSDTERNWDFAQRQYADALQQYADQKAFQERQYADTRSDAERNWDFTQRQYADTRSDIDRNWDFTQSQYGDSKAQQAYGNLSTAILTSGYQPSAEELAAAGMTKEQANALRQAWIGSNPALAYMSGQLSAEDYFKLTGMMPPGTAPAGGGGGGGPSGGPQDNGPTVRDVTEAMSNERDANGNIVRPAYTLNQVLTALGPDADKPTGTKVAVTDSKGNVTGYRNMTLGEHAQQLAQLDKRKDI